MPTILPDYTQRNELKFKFLPDLPYHARLWVVIGLWAIGLLIQAFGFPWIGAIAIFLGTIVALIRGYSNEPAKKPSGEKRWESVTMGEFRRIIKIDEEGRRWDRSALIDITNIAGFTTALLVVGILVIASVLTWPISREASGIVLLDGAAFFAPFWVTGIRRLYHRTELMIKVRALENILKHLEGPKAKDLAATPMLELQKAKEGDIPTDARLMVRFKQAPENFIGIQVQVSLNDVQGTKYPYLYCVILGKPKSGLREWKIDPMDTGASIVAEPDSAEEVDLIVVRHKTTKNSGYHTNGAAQVRVFDAALAICRRNFAH